MKINNDHDAMALALQWAERGLYTTAPNPRVGCVLVKDGALIGAGHTQPAGQAHAEVQALANAVAAGIDPRGATAYVTLEPCSHHGRTSPCADALIRAGVARVVCAIGDPNPLVAGQGLARLRAAGVAVTTDVLATPAYELNIGFFSRMRRGLPWVRLKIAASLDGKTALHNGASQWITGPEARHDGHLWRARANAILTGIGTVQADNPQLTARDVASPTQPQRVIVDSRLQLDLTARILQGPACWIATARPDALKQAALQARGHDVICIPNAHGKVDLAALLAELGRRQINEVHVEAGAKLNGALIEALCVDELLVYLAPTLLGDARGMFDLPTLTDLHQRHRLRFHEIKQIGADLRMLARFA